MARSHRLSAAREGRKPWWALVAILLFVVVDILLVVLALESTAPRPSGPESSAPRPPASGESAPSQAPTEGTAETDSPVTAVAPTRLITALDATIAWRATTGSCPDAPAAPELTTDGGESWKTTDITASTDVRALQRIFVSGPETASFIGSTGADCAPQYVRTFVAGDDFAENPEQLESSWFVSRVGSPAIHSPAGDVTAPCDAALVVAPLDASRAAVLCDDSSVHTTTDAGSSWAPVGDTAGAITLTDAGDGFIIALAGTDDCAGVQLVTVGADGGRSDISCVESPLDGPALATATAIDWNADALWMWVDDRLLISTDGGITW